MLFLDDGNLLKMIYVLMFWSVANLKHPKGAWLVPGLQLNQFHMQRDLMVSDRIMPVVLMIAVLKICIDTKIFRRMTREQGVQATKKPKSPQAHQLKKPKQRKNSCEH